MDFVVGISNGLLDFVMNSLILTSIVFAALSVLVYLVLTRIKDERIQLFIGIAGGFLLLAIPVFLPEDSRAPRSVLQEQFL